MIIVVTALILIITEPIPLPGIALYILVMEVYLGIGSPNQIASSFMNDAVFFIMGSLMLAVAIVKQGWDARIALGIISSSGSQVFRRFFHLLLVNTLLQLSCCPLP